MKTCIKCGIEKDDDEFNFRDKKMGIRHNTCKNCVKEYKELNKNKIKKYQQEYDKQYYENNKKDILEYNSNYYKGNKEKVLTQKNVRDTARRIAEPTYRLRKDCSRMIRAAIGNKNKSSILNYLPYTIEELKIHLEQQFEPWMNWSNWGNYNIKTWNDNDLITWKWQINHIIPQYKLPYASMVDDNFKKCWALENLRPLSAKQNIIDGALRQR